VQIKINTIYSR